MARRKRKQYPLEYVSEEEFYQARANWYLFTTKHYILLMPFWQFLGAAGGMDYPKGGMFAVQFARKIKLVASPHYEALLMARQIQRGKA